MMSTQHRATLSSNFLGLYNQLLDEIHMYGRGSLILWGRLLELINLGTDMNEIRVRMIRELGKALSSSLSIYEKADYYAALCDLTPYSSDLFTYLLERLLSSSRNISRIPDRIYYLSKAIKLCYIGRQFSRGDRILNSLAPLISKLDVLQKIDAYLNIGEAVYFKDFSDADSIFHLCYELTKDIDSTFHRALSLIKIASRYRRVFLDTEAIRIAKSWYDEGIELFWNFSLDKLKFLSLAVPYIYVFNETEGLKYLDMMLSSTYFSRDGGKYLARLALECGKAMDDLDVLDKIDFVSRRLLRMQKVSEKTFLYIQSAIINASSRIDIYKAYGQLRHNQTIIASLEVGDIEWITKVLKNISGIDIPFSFMLTESLVEESLRYNFVEDAILLLSNMQEFFPKKIDEFLRHFIVRRIRRDKDNFYKYLPLLSRLQSPIIDELLREELRNIELYSNPIHGIEKLAEICHAIIIRNRIWGAELCSYIREQIDQLSIEDRLKLLVKTGNII